MRLDQKYFIPFILVCTLLGAILITISTYYFQKNKENKFLKRIQQTESLDRYKLPLEFSDDSLQISQFKDKYVVLNFWASWSDFSSQMHVSLNELSQKYPDKLAIIAASVRDGKEQVDEYRRNNNFSFQFVEGTALYDSLEIPGVPANIIFNPNSQVIDVQVGYQDSLQVSEALRGLRQ
mgnify:FL=1